MGVVWCQGDSAGPFSTNAFSAALSSGPSQTDDTWLRIDVARGRVTRVVSQILGGLRERYESHHKLTYTDEALEAAAKLAHQFISDRFLPDKAIDLIDEAGSRVRLRHAALPEEARELDKELKVRVSSLPTYFSPAGTPISDLSGEGVSMFSVSDLDGEPSSSQSETSEHC